MRNCTMLKINRISKKITDAALAYPIFKNWNPF